MEYIFVLYYVCVLCRCTCMCINMNTPAAYHRDRDMKDKRAVHRVVAAIASSGSASLYFGLQASIFTEYRPQCLWLENNQKMNKINIFYQTNMEMFLLRLFANLTLAVCLQRLCRVRTTSHNSTRTHVAVNTVSLPIVV